MGRRAPQVALGTPSRRRVTSTRADRLAVPRLTHEPALDGLRAVAALVVLGFHARIPGFAHGSIGVDVFFTLSGFLITSLLLGSLSRSGRVRYRDFYARRALRLLPAYVAVVVFAVLADLVVDSGGTVKGAVYSFLYVANWAVGGFGAGLGGLGHTWSLSIEEQFYLVWPVLLVLVVRACRFRLPALRVAVAGLLVASYVLTLALLAAGVSTQLVYNATPTRAVELLAGALLATLLTSSRVAAGTRSGVGGVLNLLGWSALVMLLTLSGRGGFGGVGEILVLWPLTALLTCTVIAVTTTSVGTRTSVRRVLSAAPLVGVGRRSYGLYLWHFPVFTSIDAAVGLDTWPPRLVGLAVTAVLTWASFRYVEQPFLRQKDRLPRPAGA